MRVKASRYASAGDRYARRRGGSVDLVNACSVLSVVRPRRPGEGGLGDPGRRRAARIEALRCVAGSAAHRPSGSMSRCASIVGTLAHSTDGVSRARPSGRPPVVNGLPCRGSRLAAPGASPARSWLTPAGRRRSVQGRHLRDRAAARAPGVIPAAPVFARARPVAVAALLAEQGIDGPASEAFAATGRAGRLARPDASAQQARERRAASARAPACWPAATAERTVAADRRERLVVRAVPERSGLATEFGGIFRSRRPTGSRCWRVRRRGPMPRPRPIAVALPTALRRSRSVPGPAPRAGRARRAPNGRTSVGSRFGHIGVFAKQRCGSGFGSRSTEAPATRNGGFQPEAGRALVRPPRVAALNGGVGALPNKSERATGKKPASGAARRGGSGQMALILGPRPGLRVAAALDGRRSGICPAPHIRSPGRLSCSFGAPCRHRIR